MPNEHTYRWYVEHFDDLTNKAISDALRHFGMDANETELLRCEDGVERNLWDCGCDRRVVKYIKKYRQVQMYYQVWVRQDGGKIRPSEMDRSKLSAKLTGTPVHSKP